MVAHWLADLLAYGLTTANFVPPAEIQARHIQKVLETTISKLTNVLSDVLGHSGRATLDALIAGENDADG